MHKPIWDRVHKFPACRGSSVRSVGIHKEQLDGEQMESIAESAQRV